MFSEFDEIFQAYYLKAGVYCVKNSDQMELGKSPKDRSPSRNVPGTAGFLMLLCPDFRSLYLTQYWELENVPYMDTKVYESNFLRTWNHINRSTMEGDMPELLKKGQSAEKLQFSWMHQETSLLDF